jgi:hypothetical protein
VQSFTLRVVFEILGGLVMIPATFLPVAATDRRMQYFSGLRIDIRGELPPMSA